MIHGITVLLYEKRKTGTDAFNAPVYEEATEDLVSDLQLYGKRTAYTLAIPKGDTHDWEDVTVEFFGRKWRTFGGVTQGIEDMIPLPWNKKVKVERYG